MPRLKYKFKLVVGLLLSISGLLMAETNCPYPDQYIEIDRAYHECKNGWVKTESSCSLFVEKLPLLFPRYECMRSFDTDPVPAIWLFGAAGEDYIEMLYQLALGTDGIYGSNWFSKEHTTAREVFLSPEFKAVLDGALAENYYPLIEAVNAP
jgi:hypothetical protein